jgi:hypothetical protein
MRLAIAVVLLLSARFTSQFLSDDDDCATSAKAIPICTLLADAAKYDGTEITLRGVYRMVIHGSILMGPACPKDDVNLRRAAYWKGDHRALATIRSLTKKDQFQSVDVVSRGIFRVAHEGQCFGQNCLPYEIEETELLCATKVKTSGPSGSADPKRGAVPTPTTH